MIPTTVISQLRCTGPIPYNRQSSAHPAEAHRSPEAPTPLQVTMKRLPLSRCLLALGLCHTSRTSSDQTPEMTAHSAFPNPHCLHGDSEEEISPRGPRISRGVRRNTFPTWRSRASIVRYWKTGSGGGTVSWGCRNIFAAYSYLDLLLGERTDAERCWRLAGTSVRTPPPH